MFALLKDSHKQYWDVFENLLINVINMLAPLTEFAGDQAKDSKCPKGIRSALNVRGRHLRIQNKKPLQRLS